MGGGACPAITDTHHRHRRLRRHRAAGARTRGCPPWLWTSWTQTAASTLPWPASSWPTDGPGRPTPDHPLQAATMAWPRWRACQHCVLRLNAWAHALGVVEVVVIVVVVVVDEGVGVAASATTINTLTTSVAALHRCYPSPAQRWINNTSARRSVTSPAEAHQRSSTVATPVEFFECLRAPRGFLSTIDLRTAPHARTNFHAAHKVSTPTIRTHDLVAPKLPPASLSYSKPHTRPQS